MNETIKNMLERRSIRRYKEDMPPRELLDEILRAGTYAASGRGRQAPIILAVTNRELRDRLARANARFLGKDESFDPFFGAPVVFVVLADKSVPTYIYDGSLVMGNLMLAAHSLGLGSCWIHRAREEFETAEWQELLRSLGIQGEYEGIGHCILGYPAEEKQAAPRKENYVYDLP